MEISDAAAQYFIDQLADMSGLTLWRVKTTWAHKGREGETDNIIQAKTAIEALAIAWEPEDHSDLRTVSIEWLTPIECILTASDNIEMAGHPVEDTDGGM